MESEETNEKLPIAEKTQDNSSLKDNLDIPIVFHEDETPQSLNEKGTTAVELGAIKRATDDEAFINSIADKKKKQIEKSVESNAKIMEKNQEAAYINAQMVKDKAMFERWKPVLEFGGVKESHDRVFLIVMLCILFPIYLLTTIFIKLPFSVLNALLNVINEILVTIATFGKAAKSIAVSLLVLLVISAIGYVVYFFLCKYGVISV